MARLRINDGYTLSDKTPEGKDGEEIPVIAFEYRPAMPEALYDWQYDSRQAPNGKAILAIDAKFVHEHLVRWDVVVPDPADPNRELPAPLTVESIRALPKPYLDYIINKVATWAPAFPSRNGKPAKPSAMGEAEKNLPVG